MASVPIKQPGHFVSRHVQNAVISRELLKEGGRVPMTVLFLNFRAHHMFGLTQRGLASPVASHVDEFASSRIVPADILLV